MLGASCLSPGIHCCFRVSQVALPVTQIEWKNAKRICPPLPLFNCSLETFHTIHLASPVKPSFQTKLGSLQLPQERDNYNVCCQWAGLQSILVSSPPWCIPLLLICKELPAALTCKGAGDNLTLGNCSPSFPPKSKPSSLPWQRLLRGREGTRVHAFHKQVGCWWPWPGSGAKELGHLPRSVCEPTQPWPCL